jgi:hypothetical protein
MRLNRLRPPFLVLLALCGVAFLVGCRPTTGQAQNTQATSSAVTDLAQASASEKAANASWDAARAQARASIAAEVASMDVDQLRALAVKWLVGPITSDPEQLERTLWANGFLDRLKTANQQYNAKSTECNRIAAAAAAANPSKLGGQWDAFNACMAQP